MKKTGKDYEIAMLLDFYGELLTEKQAKAMELYYNEDLSLAEIASIYNVSRNAVYDQLNKIYNLLNYYEEKLGLVSKQKKYEDIFNNFENDSNESVKQLINKLRSVE